MTVRDYLSNTASEFRRHGPIEGLRHAGREVLISGYRRVDDYGHLAGQNVFDRDWDLLVILDACRVDLMQEVLSTNDFEFVGNFDTHISPASASNPWMKRTFTEDRREEMAETAYITGNPFSDWQLTDDEFALLDEVWRDSWDGDAGTVRPRALTDRAISAGRNGCHQRTMVHYMQPHYPFLPDQIGEGVPEDIGENHDDVWELLKRREVELDRVWEAYRENLELVMEDVRLLLSNFDADQAIITADHGNAVGEKAVYGHPSGVPTRELREVPWVSVNATDEKTHNPSTTQTEASETVAERLHALGYKET